MLYFNLKYLWRYAMRKLFAAAVIGFAILASGVFSTAGAADLKIGYCNVDRVINESDEGKKAFALLKEIIASKQAALQEKSKTVEKMKSDLDKQGASMSADVRTQKVDEFERARRDLQQAVSDANTDIEIKKKELTAAIYKEVFETVNAFAQQKKYSVILPVTSLLYGEKALDITDLIIIKYNVDKRSKKTSN